MALEHLDLKKFFRKGGVIHIPFNSHNMTAEDFSKFVGVWFFQDKKENSIFVDQSTKLTYGKRSFDIYTYYNLLMRRYVKWTQEHPEINFPDIKICDDVSKIEILDDVSLITISNKDLSDEFDFTLNHELGHLHYHKTIKNKVDKSFKQIKPLINFSYLKYFLISLLSFLMNMLLFENLLLKLVLTNLMTLFFSLMVIDFYGLKLVSKKLKNFSSEFYADFYAKFHSTEKSANAFFQNNSFLKNYSFFTHPSISIREKEYHENIAKEYWEWINPVKQNKQLAKHGIGDLMWILFEDILVWKGNRS